MCHMSAESNESEEIAPTTTSKKEYSLPTAIYQAKQRTGDSKLSRDAFLKVLAKCQISPRPSNNEGVYGKVISEEELSSAVSYIRIEAQMNAAKKIPIQRSLLNGFIEPDRIIYHKDECIYVSGNKVPSNKELSDVICALQKHYRVRKDIKSLYFEAKNIQTKDNYSIDDACRLLKIDDFVLLKLIQKGILKEHFDESVYSQKSNPIANSDLDSFMLHSKDVRLRGDYVLLLCRLIIGDIGIDKAFRDHYSSGHRIR